MPKKTFKTAGTATAPASPAASYFSQGGEPQETKSKRAQLVLRYSTWEQAQKIAARQRCSFNELVSRLLEKCIEENRDAIEWYNENFGEDGGAR